MWGAILWSEGDYATGPSKQARTDSSRKISDFFSHHTTPSPTKTRHVEVQTELTLVALTSLEGKASNSNRIASLEHVSLFK